MNIYSDEEAWLILEEIGVNDINYRSKSIRGCCPVHEGSDNRLGFAVWLDDSGLWRATCHTRGCVKASTLEWLVAKVKHCNVADATKWIANLLNRPDLQVPTNMPHAADMRVEELPAICLYDKASWERLAALYPYHDYWKGRGYSEAIVKEFGLTYRTLDNKAIIPVQLENGEFVGIMERGFDPEGPKYYWSSPNAEKGRFLFGLPQALKRTIKVDGMRIGFLAEGYLDGVKATAEGFPVVTAGTNRLSAAQALSIIGHWDVVIVLPDNDIPGQHLLKDVEKHLSPLVDTAVFQLPFLGPATYKDLDEVPQEYIAPMLRQVIEIWRTTWKTASRFKKQRLLELTVPI